MKKYLTIFLIIVFLLSLYISSSAEDTVSKIIFIDPGHGGIDGGCSFANVKESDLNLSISLKLKDILISNGYEVILSRDGDYDLATDPDNRKKTDIRKRVEMINKSNADFFISIHMNSFVDKKYSGAQTFYSSNNVESEQMAIKIQNSIVAYMQNTNRIAKKISNIYLLDHTVKKGCLIECGFLSNDKERNLLLDEKYQSKMAYAIFYGIC